MKQQLTILIFKAKAILGYILALFLAFILPIQGLLITVFVAIGMDTIYGLFRAYKRNETITSRKLSQVISKILLYLGSILVVYAVEKFMLGDILQKVLAIPFFLTKGLAALFTMIELMSISESYKLLTGVSIFEKFKLIIRRTNEIKGLVGSVTKEVDITQVQEEISTIKDKI